MDVLKHLGQILRWLGWAWITLAIVFLYLIPFVRMGNYTEETLQNFSKEYFWSEVGITKLVSTFGIAIALIVVGGYVQRSFENRWSKLKNEAIGMLKLYGRVQISELSSKLSLSQTETVKLLAQLRQEREHEFSIDENDVVMPGHERERPKKEKEIVRETEKIVVKTPCPHCGTLNDVNAEKCVNCGSTMKK